jgi:hypothetical protein
MKLCLSFPHQKVPLKHVFGAVGLRTPVNEKVAYLKAPWTEIGRDHLSLTSRKTWQLKKTRPVK